ncbi:MAG: glycosyltransferase family 87 protein [Gaiellaceae bacterium]
MSRATRLWISITTIVALGLLPVLAVTLVFVNVVRGGKVTDFENVFHVAAQAVLDGENPYPSPDSEIVALGKAYVYPPLTALAAVPTTLLSAQTAGILVMALLYLVVAGTLAVLGIRDWRCYGVAFLWPPVISAVQTGNITLLLGLAAALTWRLRDSARGGGAALGASLAAKFILWPLGVWLAVTRRSAALAYSFVIAAALIVASWAVIAFAGVSDYVELLRRLQDIEREQGYTAYALGLDLGLTPGAASAVWFAVAGASLAAVVFLARRGDERRAFVVAVGAALACSPIVWLHYFALLLVPVAVASPQLGVAWFVPLLMYGSTGTYNGTPLQTALTLVAAALTIAAALSFTRPRSILALRRAHAVDVRESR